MKARNFIHLGRLIGVVLGASCAFGVSAATPNLTDAIELPLTNSTYAFATADLMGNGKQDIITADGSIWLNTSPGDGSVSFTPGPMVPSAVNIAAADMNGDGKPDLIETNDQNQVAVLINTTQPGDTSPSFAAPVYFNIGGGATNVTVADVNGDGLPDLLVIDSNNNAVDVLMNTTTDPSSLSFANFQPLFTGNYAGWVVVGDLNGDGLPDLVVVNVLDSTVSVFINTTPTPGAAPSFTLQQVFPVGNIPFMVTLADVNGDGKLDIIVANNNENFISVLINNTANGSTTANFGSEQTFATGGVPNSLTAMDVDGDGKMDIVAANSADSTISVLINNASAGATSASFEDQQVIALSGVDPEALIPVDLNGDGKLDLAVLDAAGYSGWPSVSLLVNTN